MEEKIKTLNSEQTSALMESAWGSSQDRDRKILIFILNTGLKINEFVALDIEDVYTGKRVKRALLLPGEGDKIPRKVPLNREAREAVASMLEYNRNHGSSLEPQSPLVISRQRNRKDGSYRITARQVQRIIKTMREDASLGFKTTPQTLRHTFAKRMLGQGQDLQSLQKLLGHRSIKTTRDLYGAQQN